MRHYFFKACLMVLIASCGSADGVEPQETSVCISDSTHRAQSVYLTSDEKGIPVISWCETDKTGEKFFYFSYFDLTAEKFLTPNRVPIDPRASLHEEGMPKVAIKGDGSIVAVYETAAPTQENRYAGSVYYQQSSDWGETWSPPIPVHADTAASGSHSFASITRLSNGEIGACWLDASLDHKKSGRPVKFASTSGSSGFGNEVMIEPRACECCRTAISCDEKGNVSVAFRSITNDSIRDIAVSTSANYGKTFSPAKSFSGDGWVIDGCPHNGPSVINAGGATYATWFTGGRNKGVYYTELNGANKRAIKKQVSKNGRNIQLSLLSNGSRIIAYSEQLQVADSFYSRIVVNKVEAGKVYELDITPETTHASYPAIITYGKNKVIVVWCEKEKVCYKAIEANQIIKEVQQTFDIFSYNVATTPSNQNSQNADEHQH